MDRPRVLIADDNPAMLDTVMRILEKEFQVVAAIQKPREIVNSASQFEPDVLVLDINMGEMNGFEVARLLKADWQNSKIIFLTVHQELDFIRAAFDVGASGYVFKSRLNADLLVAINTVLSGKTFVSDAPFPHRALAR
jgi:DNA-binding NarL/FixJ family response regulator